MRSIFLILMSLAVLTTSCHNRSIRTAQDITPGNPMGTKLDWRYGAGDIKIQTTKINTQLMDRWFAKTMYNGECGKPRIIITEVDNRTDCYIPTDMVRDIVEGVAINDGRYTVVVGDFNDERELDQMLFRISQDPKYSNATRLNPNNVSAPQFLGKIRITKADNYDRFYRYEDYRMTVTLYDIETQEAVDSAWDVLCKKIKI